MREIQSTVEATSNVKGPVPRHVPAMITRNRRGGLESSWCRTQVLMGRLELGLSGLELYAIVRELSIYCTPRCYVTSL